MIGPIAAIATAVSTLALLAAQAAGNRANAARSAEAKAEKISSAARKRAAELADEARKAKAKLATESDAAKLARKALADAEHRASAETDAASIAREALAKAEDELKALRGGGGGGGGGTDTIPDHPTRLDDPKPEPKPGPDKPKPGPDKPKPEGLAPKVAAEQLYQLVTSTIKAGHPRMLGDKDKPNEEIRALQLAMRSVVADGIYGPGSRSRGKELLGKEFPLREAKHTAAHKVAPEPPAPKAKAKAYDPEKGDTETNRPTEPKHTVQLPPPPPVVPGPVVPASHTAELPTVAPPIARAPKVAAEDLYAFAADSIKRGKPWLLGDKKTPSQRVALAQADMGLAADGIYGPGARARGKELIGKNFPQRA